VQNADKGASKATSIIFDGAMPAAAQRALLLAMDTKRAARSFYQIRVLGGAMDDVPVSATAYPHRGAALEVQVRHYANLSGFLSFWGLGFRVVRV
jgi:hypothetical protein